MLVLIRCMNFKQPESVWVGRLVLVKRARARAHTHKYERIIKFTVSCGILLCTYVKI